MTEPEVYRDGQAVIVLGAGADVDALARSAEGVRRDERYSSTSIVVDLTGAQYMSSTALACLVALDRKLRAIGKRLVLCSLSENIEALLTITGLDQLFEIAQCRERALDLLRLPEPTARGEERCSISGSEIAGAESLASPCQPDEYLHRLIPVSAYLSGRELQDTNAVEAAISAICKALRIELHEMGPARDGSWFKRWLGRTKDAVTHPEVLKRLEKAERALELLALEVPQAKADQPRLEGAADLLKAIGNNEAVVQIGSVLLVKRDSPTGSGQVVIRTLTQRELRLVEDSQDTLRMPRRMLELLATEATPAQGNDAAVGEGA